MRLVGTKIGSIRITDFLGKGGMGNIYAGFDERLRREVALKALRGNALDAPARLRLLREARSLSRLSHRHICAIYDLIEHEEGSFLVLERIHGKTLREALADGLAPAVKMRIAEEIAGALAAAHAKGIVHRDLKLSNVMLAVEGGVKVLDFGLARSSGEPSTGSGEAAGARPAEDGEETAEWTALLETSFGTLVGTAACMSPEQARGEEVTTASDVYSFGLLLQELFTGVPPYAKDVAFHLLLVKAREGDTLPVTGIDRDLAALLARMKALEPAERPTAAEVLRRLAWIREKPKRRLRWVAAVAAVLLLAAGAVKYTVDLRRERDRAVLARTESERTRAESEEVAKFLEEVFKVSDPRAGKGGDTPARELLDRGAVRVRTELRGQPLVRARLMGTIGRIYVRLGLFQEAEPLLQEALAVRERELGPERIEVAQSLLDLSGLDLARSRPDAEPRLLRALGLFEKLAGPQSPEVAKTLNNLGAFYFSQGRFADQERVLRRALPIREKNPRDPELAIVLHNLGIARARQDDPVEAERLFRRALKIREEILPPDHPDLAGTNVALGVLLAGAGRPAEAVPLYRHALASLEKRLGPEHPLVALTLNNLGGCETDLGHYAAAETALRRALAIREKVFGQDHVELVASLRALAVLYGRQGRRADLEAVVARGLAIADRNLPAAADDAAQLRALLAQAHPGMNARAGSGAG